MRIAIIDNFLLLFDIVDGQPTLLQGIAATTCADFGEAGKLYPGQEPFFGNPKRYRPRHAICPKPREPLAESPATL